MSIVPGGGPERLPSNAPSPALVYVATLGSAQSRRTMLGALDTMAQILSAGAIECAADFPWHELRHEHTAALRTRLMQAYSPSTVNKFLAALRRTLQEAWRLEQMDTESYSRAADLSNVKNTKLPAGRDIAYGEIQAMVEACLQDHSVKGIRDTAIIVLLFAALRRSEIVGADLEDYNRNTGRLKVLGKGRKERALYLDDGSMEALNAWIAVRGSEPGALLYMVSQRGELEATRLSSQTIYDVVEQRRIEAGLEPLTPHDFRRSAIGDMLDQGVDIATVAQIVGHKDVNTTAKYDRRPDRTKKRAAKTRHLPYRTSRAQ